jgi:hypothetical protein
MSKEYKKVERNEVSDIICDMCHRSCKRGITSEYMEVYAKWGFSSSKDTTKWEAHFCEECADKIDEFVTKEGGQIPRDVYFLVV